MRKKICLVEDDKTIAKNLIRLLQSEGFAVGHAGTQREASAMLAESRFDMALVDISLPDGNGFAVCTEIQQTQNIPVIFLTASGDESSVVTGLNMGADDYITKPFHIAVLESRIQAVLRRVGFHRREDHDELICGEIRLDKQRMQVYAGDENIILTGLEYRLLLMLMENKGCILSRNRILEKIWDIEGNFVNDNTLTVAIKRLREKIGQAAGITTVRRIGYRMEERK